MIKTNWEDEPSTNTPLDAATLNNMENNIEQAINEIAIEMEQKLDFDTGIEIFKIGDILIQYGKAYGVCTTYYATKTIFKY